MADFAVRPGVTLPNQQLVSVIQQAAANAPPGISKVEVIDGKDNRPNLPSSYHTTGNAIDIQLYDQSGQPIYNEPVDGSSTAAQKAQTAQAFPVYQQFANSVNQLAQQNGLNVGWGGYFGLTKNADGSMANAADLMHFDLGGARGTLGSFNGGLNQTGVAFLPGTSPGIAPLPPADVGGATRVASATLPPLPTQRPTDSAGASAPFLYGNNGLIGGFNSQPQTASYNPLQGFSPSTNLAFGNGSVSPTPSPAPAAAPAPTPQSPETALVDPFRTTPYESTQIPAGPFGSEQLAQALLSGDPQAIQAAQDQVKSAVLSQAGIFGAGAAQQQIIQYLTQTLPNAAPGALRDPINNVINGAGFANLPPDQQQLIRDAQGNLPQAPVPRPNLMPGEGSPAPLVAQNQPQQGGVLPASLPSPSGSLTQPPAAPQSPDWGALGQALTSLIPGLPGVPPGEGVQTASHDQTGYSSQPSSGDSSAAFPWSTDAPLPAANFGSDGFPFTGPTLSPSAPAAATSSPGSYSAPSKPQDQFGFTNTAPASTQAMQTATYHAPATQSLYGYGAPLSSSAFTAGLSPPSGYQSTLGPSLNGIPQIPKNAGFGSFGMVPPLPTPRPQTLTTALAAAPRPAPMAAAAPATMTAALAPPLSPQDAFAAQAGPPLQNVNWAATLAPDPYAQPGTQDTYVLNDNNGWQSQGNQYSVFG